MGQQRRRVSYVIPPPDEPVPLLRLPLQGTSRLGSIGPLIIPLEGQKAEPEEDKPKLVRHPRHRLGISSLALDVCTQLAGRSSPEGILYSGGRDGLIMSWDLGIKMKKRRLRERDMLERQGSRWEMMTGWADDMLDEEAEEGGDGDILGDVASSKKRPRGDPNHIPYENEWETDMAAFKPGGPSEFRQCVQANTDWINDILLCNHNQTVVSASSDGTVKAWSPHLPSSSDPSTIGTHNDYVRCLTHSREQNWVASGSFDRTVKLWDLTRSHQHDPLVTLNPPDATAPKSSVYALAADPFGRTIVSGSPERVVRLWDPRTGKRIGKLVGHTDNIRAILISEDSRYLLTGSADASIKLWSLASQRCLHTFTHHTDSVWSLHSSHPSLEVFYSGDRSGLVCKIDVEDCSDISEGECILLCQDADHVTPSSDGINKILAMDDNLLWTASGHSNIKRWRVPQTRSVRASAFLLDSEGDRHPRTESPTPFRRSEAPSEVNTRPSTGHSLHASLTSSIQSSPSEVWPVRGNSDAETTLYGIPFDSLIRLVSPNEPFTSYTSTRGRDPEVATLYSAASIMSVPRTNMVRSPTLSNFKRTHTSPIRSARTEDTAHPVHTSRTNYEDRELAANAVPLHPDPDDVIAGDFGLVRAIVLNDRMHALTIDTSGKVAIWNIVHGVCLGYFVRDDVAAASNAGSLTGGSGGEKERSPREALETVRERVEGEAVVFQWSTVDTKAGVLIVHLTEKSFEADVYADEMGFAQDRRFNHESKLNLGKWVLRNLFLGFIREEQRIRRDQDENGSSDGVLTPSLGRIGSPAQPDLHIDIPKKSSDSPRKSTKAMPSNTVIYSSKMIPALPPTVTPSTRSSPLLTPLIPLYAKENTITLPSIPQSPLVDSNDVTPTPQRLRSATLDNSATPANLTSTTTKDGDYFSGRTRQPSLPGVPPTPDDFSAWGGSGKAEPPTPSTPGGLMGRLKNFGKMSTKRPASEVTSSPVIGAAVIPEEASNTEETITASPVQAPVKTSLQILLANPLNPPTSADAPTYPLPANTAIFISEEASPSFTVLYRGTVASTKHDLEALEETMPMWLVEYLLFNKAPSVPVPVKLSFVLLPWPSNDPNEQLPELLNTTQSKLTASRYLRVRQLVIHVQEKLDKVSPEMDPKLHPRAEDVYEVLCNDVLLPLGMTLAAVRQYVWKQSTELTIYYRRISSSQLPPSHEDPPPVV